MGLGCSVDADTYTNFHTLMNKRYGEQPINTSDGNRFETCWRIPALESEFIDYMDNQKGTFGIVMVSLAKKSPMPNVSDTDSRKICQSNLKQVLLCMAMYCDSNGKYPPQKDWDKVLLKDYVTDEKLLYCPADSKLYSYFGENIGSAEKLQEPSEFEILCCPKHKLVGFTDGHVSFSRH